MFILCHLIHQRSCHGARLSGECGNTKDGGYEERWKRPVIDASFSHRLSFSLFDLDFHFAREEKIEFEATGGLDRKPTTNNEFTCGPAGMLKVFKIAVMRCLYVFLEP